MSETDEIRQAAARLRDTEGVDGHQLDSDSRELLAMARVLLRAREPLADWLDVTAIAIDSRAIIPGTVLCAYALAVAHAVNSQAQPGPNLGGAITDHWTGSKT